MAEVVLHRNSEGHLEPVVFPVLEVWITRHENGKIVTREIPSCRFHDLWSAPDEELAGMGLAIIGNLTKHLGRDLYDETLEAKLLFKRSATDKGIEMPWPGMLSDNPALPLDLTELPFDVAIFNEDGVAKRRPDRWVLMARIQIVWVPFLKQQMQRSMV